MAPSTAFDDTLSFKRVPKGTVVSEFAPPAQDSYAVLTGRWTNPQFQNFTPKGTYYGSAKYRGWEIAVHNGVSPKVLKAYESAKDGYEADLGEPIDASARIYPRFERKRFPWGNAMSYLVQYQNDNTNYVPNNGMLCYEVIGFTDDHRYTIRARFGITHPKLQEFGEFVRDYKDDTFKSDSPMRRDPDYMLVEHCPASEFQPSLDDIDSLLRTIQLGKAMRVKR